MSFSLTGESRWQWNIRPVLWLSSGSSSIHSFTRSPRPHYDNTMTSILKNSEVRHFFLNFYIPIHSYMGYKSLWCKTILSGIKNVKRYLSVAEWWHKLFQSLYFWLKSCLISSQAITEIKYIICELYKPVLTAIILASLFHKRYKRTSLILRFHFGKLEAYSLMSTSDSWYRITNHIIEDQVDWRLAFFALWSV